MSVILSVELDDTNLEKLTDIVRQWFMDGLETVGSALWTQLHQRALLPGEMLIPAGKLYAGQEGDVWCRYGAHPPAENDHAGSWQVDEPYTPQGLSAFIDTVGIPDLAFVELHRLTRMTSTTLASGVGIKLYADTYESHGRRWLLLLCYGAAEFLKGPENEQRLLAFARRTAEVLNPAYGEIHRYHLFSMSMLEYRLQPEDPATRDLPPRRKLRGYGWLTIAPQEIGDRLGGVDVLASSGAFYEVAQLANGGYWLLATPDFETYDMAAATKVWQVFAPVLAKGVPMEDAPWDWPSLLVRADVRDASRRPHSP